MTENRTLGDFGAADDGQESAAETDAETVTDEPAVATESEQTTEDADEGPPEPTEPATVTYAWSPEGAVCAACGERVERRWLAGEGAPDPDALVCPDCKDW